jgi:two-component system phosphate regulon response regulator PhoB
VRSYILIVEDDDLLRSLLRIALMEEGYEVEVCTNGKEAMDSISRGKVAGDLPKMVILDLSMPVVDGWKVAAWLDADPDLRDIPVVVTSATEEHGIAAKNLHADAYLVKPYDTDEILGVVSLLSLGR